LKRKLEREYLKLGADWLACRWAVMTGRDLLPGEGTITGRLLGMMDAASEMRLVIQEMSRQNAQN
jgi:hypothetical protein